MKQLTADMIIDVSGPAVRSMEPGAAEASVLGEKDPLSAVTNALHQNAGADVFVDFDETLLLTNSTAAYLGSLRPRLLAWFILKALEVSRLWTLLPGDDKRHLYFDWMRVLIASVLMPWSLPLWRAVHAPRVAGKCANKPLVDALQASGARITIVSFGFGPIIRPLAARILPDTPVICGSPLAGFRMRRQGKLHKLTECFGRERVETATIITDSDNDRDVMSACRAPVQARWPAVRVTAPFTELYLPFVYTERAKRPGRKYLLNAVLKYDVVAILLTFAWTMPNPVLGGLGLAILHLAFWTIYEIGYVENDRLAATREAMPTLTPECASYNARFSYAGAAMWSLLISLPGLALVGLGSGRINPAAGAAAIQADALKLALPWVLFLTLVYFGFRVYNYAPPTRRLALYPLLQLLRFAGYALLVSTTLPGALLLEAVVLGRWYPYMIYRVANVRWEQHQSSLVLITFLVLLPLGIAVDAEEIVGLQSLVILVWLMFRARRSLLA